MMKDIQYLVQLKKCLDDVIITNKQGQEISFVHGMDKVMTVFYRIKSTKGRMFVIGNGGSAGIAIHMTADFLKNGGIRAQCLNNSAMLTCLGNDFGYEQIFSKQLVLLADPSDLLVAVSSSGNSPNIINAVQTLREIGGQVITFTGFREDNPLRTMGDFNVYVPICHYGIVESVHQILLQYIVDVLMETKA